MDNFRQSHLFQLLRRLQRHRVLLHLQYLEMLEILVERYRMDRPFVLVVVIQKDCFHLLLVLHLGKVFQLLLRQILQLVR